MIFYNVDLPTPILPSIDKSVLYINFDLIYILNRYYFIMLAKLKGQ